MNKFQAPQKYTHKEDDMSIQIGKLNDLHVLFYDEHYTIYFPETLQRAEIEDMAKVLSETWTLLGSRMNVLEGLRSFATVFATPLLGEVKPTFSDITWEEWCSPTYIAKEYYSRQNKLRRKR
jgi:hypothetical protein